MHLYCANCVGVLVELSKNPPLLSWRQIRKRFHTRQISLMFHKRYLAWHYCHTTNPCSIRHTKCVGDVVVPVTIVVFVVPITGEKYCLQQMRPKQVFSSLARMSVSNLLQSVASRIGVHVSEERLWRVFPASVMRSYSDSKQGNMDKVTAGLLPKGYGNMTSLNAGRY